MAAGFNLGVLYQITPGHAGGASIIRSRIQHDISGTQTVFVPALPKGRRRRRPRRRCPRRARPANTKITLPDSVTAGFYWQATPQLALLSDISLTNWSLLKTINITPTRPRAARSTLAENWRDTVAISVGANYRLSRGACCCRAVWASIRARSPRPSDVAHSRQNPRSGRALARSTMCCQALTFQVAMRMFSLTAPKRRRRRRPLRAC